VNESFVTVRFTLAEAEALYILANLSAEDILSDNSEVQMKGIDKDSAYVALQILKHSIYGAR
jgi:hypothetical protein